LGTIIITHVWLSIKTVWVPNMVDTQRNILVWNEILEKIKEHLSPYAYKNWFKDATCLRRLADDVIEIGVPNDTYKNVIKNKFGKYVEKCCHEQIEKKVRITYAVDENLAAALRKHRCTAPSLPPAAGRRPAGNGNGYPFAFLRPVRKVREGDVVVGGFNRIAVAALKSIIRDDPESPNPLFIYAEPGMGKTFLLQMTYNELLRARRKNVIFTSCESFMNDYISSLRNGRIETFRHYFRNTDIFLLDDIHFLCKGTKKSTREEFYHTVNTLLNAGQQVVVTCNAYPSVLKQIGEDLINLMMGGMWVQIAHPDKETRRRILKEIARGEEIPEEIYEYVAVNFSRDLRELTGALTTIRKYCRYAGEAYTLSAARKALSARSVTPPKPVVGMKRIIREVCTYFNLDEACIFSASRSKKIVTARHVAIYLCNTYMREVSLGELAVMFNNSKPAVLYAGNKVARALKENDALIAPAVREISARLESQY